MNEGSGEENKVEDFSEELKSASENTYWQNIDYKNCKEIYDA